MGSLGVGLLYQSLSEVQRHLAWRLFHGLGVPDTMLRVLSGLHDSTSYQIRQGHERSDSFGLLIGFREGCPTSPICFSIFHNFAISRFLALRQQRGDDGVLFSTNPGTQFNLRRCLQLTGPNTEYLHLLAVLFADDTTGVTRASAQEVFEQDMAKALGDFVETLHAGKTHRLKPGVVPPANSTFDEAVRFLGVWLHGMGNMIETLQSTFRQPASCGVSFLASWDAWALL